MLKDRTYIRVILPLRLDWEPYYYVPAEMAKEGLAAGMRVSVLFARKKYLGVVSAAAIEPDVEEGFRESESLDPAALLECSFADMLQ